MECIYFFEGKSKNRRVNLYVIKDETDEIAIHVKTKRLLDFASRKITQTDNIYSYETFRSIYEMMCGLMICKGFKDISQKCVDKMKDDIMNVRTNVNINQDENRI